MSSSRRATNYLLWGEPGADSWGECANLASQGDISPGWDGSATRTRQGNEVSATMTAVAMKVAMKLLRSVRWIGCGDAGG